MKIQRTYPRALLLLLAMWLTTPSSPFQLEDFKKYFPTIEVKPGKTGKSDAKKGVSISAESVTDQKDGKVQKIEGIREEEWNEEWEAESSQQDDRLFQVRPNLLVGGNKITARFFNAEIEDVLRLLAKKGLLSVVISPLVEGKVKSQFYQTPVKEALASILEAHSLYYIPRGKSQPVLEIVTEQEYRYYTKIRLTETRVYRIKWSSITRVIRAIRPYLTRGVGTISVNRKAGKIAVSDLPPRLDLAEKILKRIDTENRQVLITVRIVEIQYEDETNIGMSYKVFEQSDPNATTSTQDPRGRNILTTSYQSKRAPISEQSGGLRISARIDDIPFPSPNALKSMDLTLAAIGIAGEATYLASPRVTVENNGTAKIVIGQEIPYPTAVTTSSGQFINTFEYMNAGTTLRITPRIANAKQGKIYLNIEAENSTAKLVSFSDDGTIQAPQKDMNRVKIKANCLHGQSLILSGFVRYVTIDDTAGIPLLMDIPYVKYLFSNSVTRLEKREIVVMLTPRILDNRGTPIKRLYRKVTGEVP